MLKISGKSGLRSTMKALVVILIILLLLIPLSMIRSLVRERESRAYEAEMNIIDGAGGSLVLAGPLMVLPYELDGKTHRYISRGEVSLLPEDIRISGRLEVEYRQRGIYRVPVYSALIDASGYFLMPGSEIFPEGARPLKDEFKFVIGIADMRGIHDVSDLSWNSDLLVLTPDTGLSSLGSGISALIPGSGAGPSGNKAEFSWKMEIGGGGSVAVTPLGRNSELILSGNWPSPSFQGAILPDKRELDDTGFSARWRIPEVSRPIQPWWDSSNTPEINPVDYSLRVELLEPAGAYTRIERSVKYAVIFLLIPFAVFFLFEILGGLKVHPVQYLLAGAADIMFYLLLLAFSEHIGFNVSYLIAAAAVTLLISFYSGSITGNITVRNRRSAASIPAVLSAAYLWLWVTLQSEDYALLIGSAGLFLIISLVMVLTRKVDWYAGESNRMDIGTEGNQGEPGELDVLFPEGEADDGNAHE